MVRIAGRFHSADHIVEDKREKAEMEQVLVALRSRRTIELENRRLEAFLQAAVANCVNGVIFRTKTTMFVQFLTWG